MIKIGDHIIYEKMFDELIMITPIRECQDFEKKLYPKYEEQAWGFYYGTVYGGGAYLTFKSKRSANIARNRLIRAKARYDRKFEGPGTVNEP